MSYLRAPEAPPKYVCCMGCQKLVELDDALFYKEQAFCDGCTKCACGQQSIKPCDYCQEWRCEACLKTYDYGVDRETGYHDAGEACKQCLALKDDADLPPVSVGEECPF